MVEFIFTLETQPIDFVSTFFQSASDSSYHLRKKMIDCTFLILARTQTLFYLYLQNIFKFPLYLRHL